MRVLLLQDIKKVGRKMEVKEVSDGYARNFLIAQKLAIPADDKAMAWKTDHEKTEEQLDRKFRDLAKRLESEVLEFKMKTGPKGEVFGSVTAEQIKEALRFRFGADDLELALIKPLKNLGDHEVEARLGRGIKGQIKVRLLS